MNRLVLLEILLWATTLPVASGNGHVVNPFATGMVDNNTINMSNDPLQDLYLSFHQSCRYLEGRPVVTFRLCQDPNCEVIHSDHLLPTLAYGQAVERYAHQQWRDSFCSTCHTKYQNCSQTLKDQDLAPGYCNECRDYNMEARGSCTQKCQHVCDEQGLSTQCFVEEDVSQGSQFRGFSTNKC